MRYIDVLLYPTGDAFHPIEEAIRDSPDLEPGAIHQFIAHDDGTVVMLYELAGDLEAAEEVYGNHPDVIYHNLTVSDSRILAYTHFRSEGTPVGALFDFVNRDDVLVDLPLRYEADDDEEVTALRLRAMGNVRAIKCAEKNLPEGAYAQVLDAGDYIRPLRDVRRSLTDRGKRVLDAAARLGYFETPREATLEDVVAEAGLARDTVAEHLREITAKVLGPLGRDRA